MATFKQSDNPRSSGKKPTARSRVTNGSELLVGADGRSRWARRLRDVIDAYGRDCGDTGDITSARRALIRRAATLTVECEMLEARFANAGQADASDLAAYQTACNSLRRLLESAGLAKVTGTVKAIDAPYKEPPNKRQLARALIASARELRDDFTALRTGDTGEVMPGLLQPLNAPQEAPEPQSNAHIVGTVESVEEGSIECREVAGDGREKWVIYSPTGARLTSVWGRDKAEAACKEYLETGTITLR